jgi:hypothetical protein
MHQQSSHQIPVVPPLRSLDGLSRELLKVVAQQAFRGPFQRGFLRESSGVPTTDEGSAGFG